LVHAVEQQGPAQRQIELARLPYDGAARNELEKVVIEPFDNLAHMSVALDDFLARPHGRQDIELELLVGEGGSGHRGSPVAGAGANLVPRRLAAALRD